MTVSKGRSVEEFRAVHDDKYKVPKRIREGLAKLGESWLYETEFAKLCGLGANKIGAYREEFVDFIIQLPDSANAKRVWCGTKAFATKLRGHTE